MKHSDLAPKRRSRATYSWPSRDAPKKISNELEAVELVRIDDLDPLNHNSGKKIPYKIVVRSRYDQYILYPKRKVDYMGEILDAEDLFYRFVTNVL